MTDNTPIASYKSTGMRQGLVAALPGIVSAIKIYRRVKNGSFDILAEDYAALGELAALLASWGAAAWIWIHRVWRGKHPEDPARPIESPVATVKRLTNG